MKIIKEYFWPVLATIVLVTVIHLWVFQSVTVSGPSMEPNLENKESVLVFPLGHINRMSVIVFNAKGLDPQASGNPDYYVKRVIGLPGDTVEFKNHQLLVNHKVINEKFLSTAEATTGTEVQGTALKDWNFEKLAQHWPKDTKTNVVPKGEYFVLGDHRSVSNDSRYWGFVPKSKVLGVVHTWPWSTDATKRQYINAYPAQ